MDWWCWTSGCCVGIVLATVGRSLLQLLLGLREDAANLRKLREFNEELRRQSEQRGS